MIQMELWQLIVAVITLICTVIGGFWAVGAVVVGQFNRRLEERFAGQDKSRAEGREQWERRFTLIEKDIANHAKDLQNFRLKVSEEYWRREDAIRQEVVLHAKIDALAAKIDNLVLRQQVGQA